jgi:alkanesulfonate monooxygenase SsuD/methylene tetrahydromethanopterin reductase-like flavin-dependent oxidoreductase (luciferase family)
MLGQLEGECPREADYDGQYYQVPDLKPGPQPAHQIGLWLGVVGPRAVRLAGAKADGWSVSAPYVPPERLGELNDIITSAAEDAGRDPGQLVRLYNVMGSITPDRRDPFHGPAGHWVQTLTTLYTEHQMKHLRVLARGRPGTPVPRLRRRDRASCPRRAGLGQGPPLRSHLHQPRQEPAVLFLAEMEARAPHDADAEHIARLEAEEKTRAQQLQRSGE